MAQLGRAQDALALASTAGEGLRVKCPFYYLDVLAVRAWLERQVFGRQTDDTNSELSIFETLQVPGKKALLAAQGFLA